MRNGSIPTRQRRLSADIRPDWTRQLAAKVVGQEEPISRIVPSIQMFQAGLAPEGRPAGVFLLLGPTGTGKTRTVEALAEVLHGNGRNLLRVDCGEFQMEHEVAKLIGAPPGYLGHRETPPMLTQTKLNAVASEKCPLSLVLFDEIEKAAPSMTRLLLGILDKAVLRLGDNTQVNFERCMIFLTSNLGARAMNRAVRPDFGFEGMVSRDHREARLHHIGLAAVRKKFPPEFVNRIDAVLTYQPLTAEALTTILDQQLRDLQEHLNHRLGPRSFRISVEPCGRRFLLAQGASPEYGARELKRTLHRHLVQPLAAMVASGTVEPASDVRVGLRPDGEGLCFEAIEAV